MAKSGCWTKEQGDAVADALMEMHMVNEVYVSNGTMGDIVAHNVCYRCSREGRWDKDSIRRFIREDTNFSPGEDQLPNPKPGAIESIVEALADTSKPTRPGFYWYRFHCLDEPIWEPVQLDEDGEVWQLADTLAIKVGETDASDWGPEIPLPLLDGVRHQEVPR